MSGDFFYEWDEGKEKYTEKLFLYDADSAY
jgi:hypothetical protein